MKYLDQLSSLKMLNSKKSKEHADDYRLPDGETFWCNVCEQYLLENDSDSHKISDGDRACDDCFEELQRVQAEEMGGGTPKSLKESVRNGYWYSLKAPFSATDVITSHVNDYIRNVLARFTVSGDPIETAIAEKIANSILGVKPSDDDGDQAA